MTNAAFGRTPTNRFGRRPGGPVPVANAAGEQAPAQDATAPDDGQQALHAVPDADTTDAHAPAQEQVTDEQRVDSATTEASTPPPHDYQASAPSDNDDAADAADTPAGDDRQESQAETDTASKTTGKNSTKASSRKSGSKPSAAKTSTKSAANDKAASKSATSSKTPGTSKRALVVIDGGVADTDDDVMIIDLDNARDADEHTLIEQLMDLRDTSDSALRTNTVNTLTTLIREAILRD